MTRFRRFLRRLRCFGAHDWSDPWSELLGVTLGFALDPTTCWATHRRCRRCGTEKVDEGQVYFPWTERLIHERYYPDGFGTWPRDPKTGEKLPIWTS